MTDEAEGIPTHTHTHILLQHQAPYDLKGWVLKSVTPQFLQERLRSGKKQNQKQLTDKMKGSYLLVQWRISAAWSAVLVFFFSHFSLMMLRDMCVSGTALASVSNKIERECQECGKHTCQIEAAGLSNNMHHSEYTNISGGLTWFTVKGWTATCVLKNRNSKQEWNYSLLKCDTSIKPKNWLVLYLFKKQTNKKAKTCWATK